MLFFKCVIIDPKRLSFAALALLLSACATQQTSDVRSIFESSSRPSVGDSGRDVDASASVSSEPSVSSSMALLPLMAEYAISARPSSQILNLDKSEGISASFEDAPLRDFVEHVLSNILGVDFVIDPSTVFSDKLVTMQLKEPLPPQEFLELFDQILQQHGLAIKVQENIVFLHSASSKRGLREFDYGYGRNAESVPFGSNPIFQVVPIDYIDTASVQNFVIRLTNAGVDTLPDKNLIGIRGERNDILRALDIIDLLDRPAVAGQELAFIRLEYVPVSLFVQQVTELLQSEGVSVPSVLRFTELARQNGVIVHARTRKLIDRISFWQKTLDTPESTDDKQYFLYYPENVEAKKLTEVLEQLVRLPGATANNADADSRTTLAGSDLSFVTDENRNVIIVFSSATKYKNLLPLLKKLDVTPPQVLIEARLLEVTLTDQLSQGIDWSLFGGASKRNIATGQVASLSNGSFGYTISGVDYNVAISLLQNEDRLKVLSSPRIVVASGESASINVGTEIPVLATQSADVDTDRVLQSVQYRSTGVDLNVSPTVNSNNVISLEISQNVSETSENASSGIDSPIILNRSFKTTVFANSGQALVLGGLIRENNSSKDAQVPLLGLIPGLGKLFSSESKSKSRTELIVLITPRIISNSSDIDDIRDLFLTEFDLYGEEL